jgi:hypothetical protein
MNRHPQSVHATIVQQGQNNLILAGWSNHKLNTPFCFTESHNTDWILKDKLCPATLTTILGSIQDGTAVAVSNGSYLADCQAAAAGWLIEDATQTHQLKGAVEGQGSSETQCSHHSKLLGILSIITHVNKICSQNNEQEGHITIVCDGQGAIKVANSKYKSKSSHKHFDIINSI